MGLTQYYTATSLDGFIADADHSLDWLFTRNSEADGPLNYREFIRGVGAMAMGSTTYEWILAHEAADDAPPEEVPDDAQSEWTWPPRVPCWVFTHRDLPVPDAPIQFVSGSDLAGSGLDGQAGLDPVVLAFGVLAHVAVAQRDQLVRGDLGVAAGAV